MTDNIVYLQALDEQTGETARIVKSDDLDGDLKALFKKLYSKTFGAVKWWAGVPGVDVAVVWQGTPWEGSEQYWLHISYSDGRTW